MINRNLKNLLAMGLQSSASAYGCLPVNLVNGLTQYLVGQFEFPYARSATATLVADAAGISVGSDGTAATETDRNLGATITSGITLTLNQTTVGCDEFGRPWVQYNLTVTNNSDTAITVREVGYKQQVKAVKLPMGTTNVQNVTCLIDRTVLSSPVTIAAGDAGVILYKLRTNPTPVKTVSGVEIVSWTWGTDAQVAAVLAAAQNGIIDLQRDAGWCVGDVRLVNINAFTSGNVNHAAQTVKLVITDFAEYEGCGNVMQFDFLDCLTAGNRMNSTSTNAGGYGATEMYSTTLPALESALPSWLRGLMRTFNVKSSAGSNSDEILTVSGNKLALRSEVEIMGATTYSAVGEGVHVDFYTRTSQYTGPRRKTAPSNARYWLRSPTLNLVGSPYDFIEGDAPKQGWGATTALGVAPFGCI